MRKLFFDFFSHRTLFYGLFNQAGKNLVEMAELLSAIVDTASEDEREPLYRHINALEETGDDITHKIYLGLDKVFFTPFNRKDIHILASAIDDVADNIDEAAGRMHLYNIEAFIPAIGKMARYIQLSCAELQKLINALGKIVDTEGMLTSCRLIKDNEHQTDMIYYHALAELFAHEKDPIKLIKHRDILFSLEASANKCKNVTDAIEIIILNKV
jgi:predicted phosphate transport protein (TIGR00153 family)